MRIRLCGLLGLSILLTSTAGLCAEQITSTCRITAVDAAQRKVTLLRKTAAGERAGVAKVAEDAVIKVNGEPITMDRLAVPVEGVVVYDTERGAITTITAVTALRDTSRGMSVVPLSELNTPSREDDPWISPDGRTIYWTKDYAVICCATRDDVESQFAAATELIEGRQPSLTADGLCMVLVGKSPESLAGRLCLVERQSVSATFGLPTEISEFKDFYHESSSARMPAISRDGLVLTFLVSRKGSSSVYYSIRKTRSSHWGMPQEVPIRSSEAGNLTWPRFSGDRLSLFTSCEGQGLGKLLLLQRQNETSPFDTAVPVVAPPYGQLFGRAPCYCETTKELFFAAPDPGKNQSTWKGVTDWNLWVIRRFDPATLATAR